MPALRLAGWFDQAFGTEANQVLPAGQDQGFVDQPVVFGVPVLDESPLHGLFMGAAGYLHGLHGQGVLAGVILNR